MKAEASLLSHRQDPPKPKEQPESKPPEPTKPETLESQKRQETSEDEVVDLASKFGLDILSQAKSTIPDKPTAHFSYAKDH
jgi:hypothetical protein